MNIDRSGGEGVRIKAIIDGIFLYPGELMKLHAEKNDYIFINLDGNLEVCFNRNIKLLEHKSGIFQCHYGSFYFQNVNKRPVYLQGIKFSCRIKMKNSFYETNFDESPFLSILAKKSGMSTLNWTIF